MLTSMCCIAGPPLPKFDWLSHQSILGISASQNQVNFNPLNSHLPDWGVHGKFKPYYQAIGLTYASAVSLRENIFDGAFSLEWVLPQEVGGSGDSLQLKLKGWHLMTSFFGKDVLAGDAVALVLAPGVDWGTMKIKRTVNGGESIYKNPFVAPLVRADLRFTIRRFAIGGRAMYRFDITDGIWKRKSDGMPVLRETRMSGLSLQAFIGIRLNKPWH